MFSRGEKGWGFGSVASPSLGVQTGAAEVFDPLDFSVVGFHDNIGLVGNFAIEDLVGPAGGPYAVVEEGSEKAGAVTENAYLVGASVDLGDVVLEGHLNDLGVEGHRPLLCEAAQESLAKESDEKSVGLYVWSAAGQCLSLVDIGESGGLVSRCGAELGQGSGFADGTTRGAVSADGSKVFFTAPDPLGEGRECWEEHETHVPQLYMREGGKTTVEVSSPEAGVKEGAGNPEEPAVFVGASSDGSKVFFLTKTELTKEAEVLGLHDVELYEYDTDAGEGEARLVRVSRGGPGVSEGAGVQNVPAVSADGSLVYFNATGKLTGAAPQGGGLYDYDTVTGTTTYIAQSGGYPSLPEPAGTWYGKDVLGSASAIAGLWSSADYYTTADGAFLVFPSTQDITGYDSDGVQELYRYDAESPLSEGVAGMPDNPVCVSCNPNGSPPDGSLLSVGARFARSAVDLDDPSARPPRAISENGDDAFFDTAESLVPQDTNGKVDVYEWEAYGTSSPDGSTSCAEREGCVSLITTGEDPTDSYFLDSSPDGSNVFFGTHAKLVPQDTDEQGDLYDARIDGGFPPPSPHPPCEGDACQTPPSPPLAPVKMSLPLPAPPPPPPPTTKCKRGYVKEHGRCVKTKPKIKKVERKGKRSRAKGTGQRGRSAR